MSYELNSVDLTTYGIIPGQVPGSNIAMGGIFDLPKRMGKTFHDWGDEDGIEPYVDASEIFFEGRDLVFRGIIFGANTDVYENLSSFRAAIDSVTGTSTFETPYGTFDVRVKEYNVVTFAGGAEVDIKLREPVVDLGEVAVPSTGTSPYTIDGVPMTSYGLYTSIKRDALDLPEYKGQAYTKYGAEWFHPTKRKFNKLDFRGFIEADDLTDFTNKVGALYTTFSQEGLRYLKFNDELAVTGFSDEGFTVSNIFKGTKVYGIFGMKMKIIAYEDL